jgi:alpha-beta hydrolase superfamily lysophospholipase
VLAPFTARDGENLALYEWPLNNWDSQPGPLERGPRGVVVIVHGLGEHACRYDHVALGLMNQGFVVRAYDQRGHGQSSGARGVLPSDNALLEDLAEIVDDTRERCQHLLPNPQPGRAARLPVILLGHSVGALVVSRFAALNVRPVEGLILSSPAFKIRFTLMQKLALGALATLAPNFTVSNGINPDHLSHDAAVAKRYRADPLIHDRVSVRFGRFIKAAGPATLAAASRWAVPTLLLYAGRDGLVDAAGSHAFAGRAAGSRHVPADTVTARCYADACHELFSEPNAPEVLQAMYAWLNQRFS